MVNNTPNKNLRKKIVKLVYDSGWGHIPSSFSILEIINVLYTKILKINFSNHNDIKRDYFILSKAHGCLALYVVLHKIKLINDKTLNSFCKFNSKLGEHPDANKVDFIEASCGSLGHGFPLALGIAKGMKFKKKKNLVFCLIGDGEAQEGTIWETAHLATNLSLDNLIVFLDFNKSGMQLLPIENFKKKWVSFGWDVFTVDGHNEELIEKELKKNMNIKNKRPKIFIANTIKGKGIKMIEGHGIWHHKIPNKLEIEKIFKELD